MDSSVPLSGHYEAAWLLAVMVYGGVDCFALISGFVGVGSKVKYVNLIRLCFQVLFYTLTITAVFMLVMPEAVGIKDVIKAFLPIPFNIYWYVTAYFCMFFFRPVMNFIIEQAPQAMIRNVIAAFLLTGTVLSTLFRIDLSVLSGGYSPLWLGMLYLIGAYLKKYDFSSRVSIKGCLSVYFVLVFACWGGKWVIDLLSNAFLKELYGNMLVSCTSPLIAGAAIALLLGFSKIEAGKNLKKFIAFFAPAAFGVYLIHVEPMIWDHIMVYRFVSFLNLNPVLMLLAVAAAALGIWLACSLIERIRMKLFELLKVGQHARKIEAALKSLLQKISAFLLQAFSF